jgi:hypothetical protein
VIDVHLMGLHYSAQGSYLMTDVMPVPAKKAYCSQHSMSQHRFIFAVGSQSMNTMLMTPAAQNTDATAF